ncbi:MAG TPA: carboxypeptidase-like regulatory domain-containing protein [Candidatus Cybelea sp.]
MQIAVLLMLSHFFFWPSALDWQMNQQDVVVRGSVVDGVTGRPVSGATVYATSAAFDATTVSDSKGQFIFLTLFPGTYYLSASQSGAAMDVYGSSEYEPPTLFAGYEYGATIVI